MRQTKFYFQCPFTQASLTKENKRFGSICRIQQVVRKLVFA
jgi:hypothetical protein